MFLHCTGRSFNVGGKIFAMSRLPGDITQDDRFSCLLAAPGSLLIHKSN